MSGRIARRDFSNAALVAGLAVALAGCGEDATTGGTLEIVWGRHGVSEGRLHKPRGMTIDAGDQLYLVDMTARIQVFDRDGNYLRGWSTPEHNLGRPTGISIDRNGNVVVPDTHYHRVLFYSPDGELLWTLGGTQGPGPGEFGLVTDCAQDSHGNYYVSEYGLHDRIQKFRRDGQYLLEWGSHGEQPGQFIRPQAIAIDEQDHIWVADSCNHRIQIFDAEGTLLQSWGEEGKDPGQLSYPYSLVLDDRNHVYVLEYGNHRVQKFTRDGHSLACWGANGRGPGEFHNPWALVRDGRGRLHVLDTNNHRVQRVRM